MLHPMFVASEHSKEMCFHLLDFFWDLRDSHVFAPTLRHTFAPYASHLSGLPRARPGEARR